MDFMKLAASLGMPQDVGSRALQQAIARKAMGLDQAYSAPVDRSAMPTDVGSRVIQQSIFDQAFKSYQNNEPLKPDPVITNEPDTDDSEYRRMAQQYGDAEMRNAMLNQAGEGVSLADYYGAQRQLGGMVSADEEQGKAMEDYFMTRPGFETRDQAKAFIKANPAIAFREFNKANPMAMVGDKPAMIEEESITDFMDTGLNREEAIRRIRGGMTPQTKSNLEQTAQGQPVVAQKDAINEFIGPSVPGLRGKQMLGQNMTNLLRRQGRI